MLLNLKSTIKNIAKIAVLEAESLWKSGEGQAKKEFAINFITDNLPVPAFLRKIIAKICSKLIDECIEFAVRKLKETSGYQA